MRFEALAYFLEIAESGSFTQASKRLFVSQQGLSKAIKALESTVTIAKADGKSAAGTKLMALMGLGIKQGETVTVTVEGANEEADAATLEQFFKDNL